MKVLSFPRKLTKRQEVMKKRRFFNMPKAWRFSKDKVNYYFTFDPLLAKKLYSKYRKVSRWF